MVEAETLHGGLEFPGVYPARALGVEEIERLSDLLHLVFGEAGSSKMKESAYLSWGFFVACGLL